MVTQLTSAGLAHICPNLMHKLLANKQEANITHMVFSLHSRLP